MTARTIYYVLLRFPSLTETFIAEEIRAILSLGYNVRIYSLLPSRTELVHPVSAQLIDCAQYAPGFISSALWRAQFYYLLRGPGRYFRLLWSLLTQPAPELSAYPKRLITFLKAVWIAKQLEKSPAQLVHTHFAWLSAAACSVISQLLNLPFTVTTHAFDIYSQRNDLLKLTTSNARRVVTISEYNKRAILDRNRDLRSEAIEVIHCGIDLDKFHLQARNAAPPVLQITSVGSLIEKKGHEFLIRACGELKSQGLEFNCVIVGEGMLEGSLKDLVHELNLENEVELVGAQSQTWVRDRLERSDIFVLACTTAKDGERDGIPVAMMEALAMEVPVVSTSVSGIPELIQDNITGLLVPEKDVNALATAMLRLAHDMPMQQQLAKNGRMLIEAEYDISKNAARLGSLFQEVIQEQRQ